MTIFFPHPPSSLYTPLLHLLPSFVFLLPPPLLTPFSLSIHVDCLSLPRCSWEPLIAPLALPRFPSCHRIPIVAGTHFKRSMAQVAKQPRTELTAGKAAVVDARRFMRRVVYACQRSLRTMHHTPHITFSWSALLGKERNFESKPLHPDNEDNPNVKKKAKISWKYESIQGHKHLFFSVEEA